MSDTIYNHDYDTPDLRFNIKPLILIVKEYTGNDPDELIKSISSHPLYAKVLEHVQAYAEDPRFKETHGSFVNNTLDNLGLYPIFTEAFRLTYQIFRKNKDRFLDLNLQGGSKDWSEYTDEDIVKRNTEVFYGMYYKFHLHFERLINGKENDLELPDDFDLDKLKFLTSIISRMSESPGSRFHGILQIPSFSGALLSALVDYCTVSLDLLKNERFDLQNLSEEYVKTIAKIIYKEYVFLPSRKLSITQINHSRSETVAKKRYIEREPVSESSPITRDVLVYSGDDLPHAAILGCIASYGGGIYFSIEDYLDSIKKMVDLRTKSLIEIEKA